jgi:acyl-CoA thioesterase FadM
MSDPIEFVLQTKPFIVRRRARWSECDPAGVVYTGNFTDYLISAATHFHEYLMGGFVDSSRKSLGIQTPCKSMSLVFNRAIWPNETFDMHVTIGEIRNSTYDIHVNAKLPDGTDVFNGVMTPVCIPLGQRKATEIPPSLREKLELFRAAI